jgi:Do/DeqQ family serine protease
MFVLRWATALAVVLLVGCIPGTRAQTATPSPGAPEARPPVIREVPVDGGQIRLSFAPVVRQVSPSVVSITSQRTTAANPFAQDPFFRFFFRDFPQLAMPRRQVERSLGSGVIVRDDGIVVTNHHVVADAQQIEVVLEDRRTLPATLMSSDADTDLAFLKIDPGRERLPAVTLGDSDAIAVGDLVLAIGNPFGIGQTVTSGIVSAKGRTAPSIDRDVSFIQTDAAINPGNSGGALVTLDGRLIGINTAIFTRSGGSIGIGFAIPSDLVRVRLASLASGATEIRRPWLGTVLRPVLAELAPELGLDRPRGVLVAQVYPGSASDRAGVQAGDVILAVDDVPVDEPSMVHYRLALRPLGESVKVDLVRGGAERRVSVVLEPAPGEPKPEMTRLDGPHPLAGAVVADMSPAFNEQLSLDLFERGVVVVETQRGSLASRIRLRTGDVIESVNGGRVDSVSELQGAMERATRNWQIGVRRNGQTTLLSVQV